MLDGQIRMKFTGYSDVSFLPENNFQDKNGILWFYYYFLATAYLKRHTQLPLSLRPGDHFP